MKAQIQLFDGLEPLTLAGVTYNIETPKGGTWSWRNELRSAHNAVDLWRLSFDEMEVADDGWCHANAMVHDSWGVPIGMSRPVMFLTVPWVYPSVIAWPPNSSEWEGTPHRLVLTIQAVAA